MFTQLIEKLASEQKHVHEREQQLYSKLEATDVLQRVSGFTYGSASR